MYSGEFLSFLKTHPQSATSESRSEMRGQWETTEGHRRTSVLVIGMLAILAVVREEDHRSLLVRQSSRNGKLQPGSARHPVCKSKMEN